MKCHDCPVEHGTCLGESHDHLCGLKRRRPAYRGQLRVLAGEAPSTDDTPARLARIAACPHRGSVLPHTQQPECGCRELTECRLGRGKHPGRVTTADCLACPTIAG